MSYGSSYTFPYGSSTILAHSEGYQESQWQNATNRLTDIFKIRVNPDGSFEGPQNIGNILGAKSISQQYLEDFIDWFMKINNLNNASGWLLKTIGKYFNLTQKSTENDIAFKKRIRANITANASKGTGKDIYDLANLIVDDNTFCKIKQYTPNTFIVTTDGSVTDESDYKTLMDRATGDVYQNAIGLVDNLTPFNFASARSLANRQVAASGSSTVLRILKSNCLKENFGSVLLGGNPGTAGEAYFLIQGDSFDAVKFRYSDTIYYAGDTTFTADGDYIVYKSIYQGDNTFKVYVRETITAATFDGSTLGVGIKAGEFNDGEICVIDGTSSADVRTIDSTGAFTGTTGYWDFTVTSAFTSTLDSTSYVNLVDFPNNGFAGASSYSNLQLGSTTLPFQVVVLKTSFSPVISAGDFANGIICVTEGEGKGDVRIIDSNGAQEVGLYWVFDVTEPFNVETHMTSANYITITDERSFLGYLIS